MKCCMYCSCRASEQRLILAGLCAGSVWLHLPFPVQDFIWMAHCSQVGPHFPETTGCFISLSLERVSLGHSLEGITLGAVALDNRFFHIKILLGHSSTVSPRRKSYVNAAFS